MPKSRWILLAALGLALFGCATTGGDSDSDSEYDWDDDGSYGERYDTDRYFEPEYGCRCDRRDSVCYDRYGAPSYAHTGRYFGGSAAERLRGGGYLFEPSQGVTCDRRRAVCFDDDGPSVRRTREIFGERAADRVDAWKHARGGGSGSGGKAQPSYVFRPDAETTCDQRTRICYGNQKPSVAKTRKYFGEAAAARVEAERAGGLKDDDGQIFTPKSGVKCDRAVRICYSQGGASVTQTEKHFGVDAAAKLRRDQLCAQGKGACDNRDRPTSSPRKAGPSAAEIEAERAAKQRALEEKAARQKLELEQKQLRKQQEIEQKAAKKQAELERKLEKQRAAEAAKEEKRQKKAAEKANSGD